MIFQFKNIKQCIVDKYLANYFDVPPDTGKILPLIVIESMAICISHYISLYLIQALQFTPFQVGRLIASLSLGTCLGSPIGGYLTTKLSAIKVSATGILMYSLGFFSLFLVKDYTLLLLILFFIGIAGVLMMIANLTALIRLAKDDRMKNRIIILQSVIFNISVSVCAFIISYFPIQSFTYLFAVFGILLLTASILVYSMDNHTPLEKPKRESIHLNKPLLLMIIPSVFFYGMLYSLIKMVFPVETVSRFNNPLFTWLILSANPIMVVFFQPFLINSLKYRDNLLLLASGACFLGLGYTLFGLSRFFITSLLYILIATTSEMLFSPISKKMASSAFGAGNEGIGLASWKMTYYLSGVFGATLVGYIGEYYKNVNIWYLCIPFSLAIIAFTAFYWIFEYRLRSNVMAL